MPIPRAYQNARALWNDPEPDLGPEPEPDYEYERRIEQEAKAVTEER